MKRICWKMLYPVAAVMILISAGCTDRGDSAEVAARGGSSNIYLKNLPEMLSDGNAEVEQLWAKIYNAPNQEEMDKLQALRKETEQNWNARLGQYVQKHSLSTPVPLTALNEGYILGELTIPPEPFQVGIITHRPVSLGGVRMRTTLSLAGDELAGAVRRMHMLLYFKGIDTDGRDIPGAKIPCSVLNPPKLADGQPMDLILQWPWQQVAAMSSLGGIVQITKEEYDAM